MTARKSKKPENLHAEEKIDQKKPASSLDERIAGLENSLDSLTQLLGDLSSQINQLNAHFEQDLAAERRIEEAKTLRRAEMRDRGLRFVALLYLAAMLFSLLMIVKPGAKLFYFKSAIESEKIELSDDAVYRYPLDSGGMFWPLDKVMIFENSQPLERVGKVNNVKAGQGRFTLSDPDQGTYYVHFSSTDETDPRQNGYEYQVYYPLAFVSRSMGIFYLSVFSLGIVWLLFRQRKKVGWRQNLMQTLRNIYADVSINVGYWQKLFLFVVACAYLYAFMEWLFLVTMPSFMDIMSLPQKLAILVLAGLVIAAIGLLALLIAFVVDMVLLFFKITRRFVFAGVLVPAGILAGLSLLLFDNFTYTLFKFGVVSSAGPWRGAYALAVILLMVYFVYKLSPFAGLAGKTTNRWITMPRLFYLVGGLLLVSVVIALATYQKPVSSSSAYEEKTGKSSRRPNILLLGADGLNATSMSLYGNERDTTPRLLEFSQLSLVAENAFPNGAQSTGSIVSLFTSKLPIETRVIYAPDILTGVDAYQHLPGILRTEGYHTVQLAVTHYIDANDVNLQNGFDNINGQAVTYSVFSLFLRDHGFGDEAYFLEQVSKRIGDRLRHIFYIEEMENPFSAVTASGAKVSYMKDQAKVNQVIDLLTNAPQPVFMHVHMMGTHGPLFNFRRPVFSDGEKQTEYWMTDFYHDAILDFDRYVGEILDALKEAGELDNTIIIIYSDHAQKYTINRTPLLFHFPKDEYAGRIQANAQNLDIAPTILDYLGLEIPQWMDGQSLLHGNLDPHRLIFSIGDRDDISLVVGFNFAIIDPSRIEPPFYQFGKVFVTECQRWYELDLVKLTWSSGDRSLHTSHCSADSLYSFKQIQQAVAELLSSNGFDISTLPED